MKGENRRLELLKILNNRRNEKTENLAFEFGVSVKTIRRDISLLSESYPIYTISGIGGGVFMMENCDIEKNKLSEPQRKFLQKLMPLLSEKERPIMTDIIKQFT